MSDADDHRIAAHRFGYGPQRGGPGATGVGHGGRSAQAALIDQLRRFDPVPPELSGLAALPAIAAIPPGGARPATATAMPDSADAAMGDADSEAARQARQARRRAARRSLQDHYLAQVQARFDVAVNSDTPFAERLVHFWANHFAVSVDRVPVRGLAGRMEMDAVRPHVTGRFADMLAAVVRHPAMLLYLDQVGSIGPGSPAGLRRATRGRARAGLNENLAREILELHTLGARGGYTQQDVGELARALTGFTAVGWAPGVGAMGGVRGTAGDFAFLPAIHEPGERRLLGRAYAAAGEAQAQAMLDDLALHPSTAQHLSIKLARHFVADDPPPALVARLERALIDGRGDLTRWYQALIDSPDAWVSEPRKAKSPWDWMVSAARTLSPMRPMRPQALFGMFNALGQLVWRPGSPAGFGDTNDTWLAPDALLRRVEITPRLVALASVLPDARRVAPLMFGSGLSRTTADLLAGAADGKQAMAILLLSPEFLRR